MVNAVWEVSSAEIESATALLDAYEAHLANGIGVFSHNGTMVDEATVRHARILLGR